MTLKELLTAVGNGVKEEQTRLGAHVYSSPAEGYGHLVMALSDVFGYVKTDPDVARSPDAREAALRLAIAAVRYAQEVARDEA